MRITFFIPTLLCLFVLLSGCNSTIDETNIIDDAKDNIITNDTYDSNDNTATNIINDTNEDNVKWDYRPMVFFQDKLYGETGNFYKELPSNASTETPREILTQGKSHLPMEYEKGYSNTLAIGTKIYFTTDESIIYAEIYHPTKGDGYILYEEIEIDPIRIYASGQCDAQHEENSNLIIMVSNQSFDVPSVQIDVAFDKYGIIDDKFSVGDQHQYTYYYCDALPGEHEFEITANDVSIKETMTVSEDETLWICFSYWNSESEDEKITVVSQNEQILID